MIQLSIIAAPSIVPGEFDYMVRFNGRSFEHRTSPRMIGARWQCKSEPISHFYRSCRKQSAGSLFSNDGCELFFSREGDNHLRRAGSMAIDEQNNLSMERLGAQSFGFEDDRLLCQQWTH